MDDRWIIVAHRYLTNRLVYVLPLFLQEIEFSGYSREGLFGIEIQRGTSQ